MVILNAKTLVHVALALAALPTTVIGVAPEAGAVIVAAAVAVEESESPSETCASEEEVYAAISRQNDKMELTIYTGCHFGNTDTCSDQQWYHRVVRRLKAKMRPVPPIVRLHPLGDDQVVGEADAQNDEDAVCRDDEDAFYRDDMDAVCRADEAATILVGHH